MLTCSINSGNLDHTLLLGTCCREKCSSDSSSCTELHHFPPLPSTGLTLRSHQASQWTTGAFQRTTDMETQWERRRWPTGSACLLSSVLRLSFYMFLPVSYVISVVFISIFISVFPFSSPLFANTGLRLLCWSLIFRYPPFSNKTKCPICCLTILVDTRTYSQREKQPQVPFLYFKCLKP